LYESLFMHFNKFIANNAQFMNIPANQISLDQLNQNGQNFNANHLSLPNQGTQPIQRCYTPNDQLQYKINQSNNLTPSQMSENQDVKIMDQLDFGQVAMNQNHQLAQQQYMNAPRQQYNSQPIIMPDLFNNN